LSPKPPNPWSGPIVVERPQILLRLPAAYRMSGLTRFTMRMMRKAGKDRPTVTDLVIAVLSVCYVAMYVDS